MCARLWHALTRALNDAKSYAQQGCAMQYSGITLSLCIRRLSCVSIYKSANDKIVQTGIEAKLEGKKKILSVSHLVMACDLYLCLSSEF